MLLHSHALAAAAASLLLLPSGLAAGLYTKTSPVIQIDAGSYQPLIAKSNRTSIVEFYAPWCGHCQNLKPAYEKAAHSLKGQANVAAVNCDDEANKPFCGSMGVQGFPTLKIVRPVRPKTDGKRGRPAVEDYQGPRSAKAIVDAVREKIPNYVRRLKDGDFEHWLGENEGRPKAILFSDKGTVSALLKGVAIDFLDALDIAQIRDKERQAVEVFGIEKFPSLVLLPGDNKDPITFEGELENEAIVRFLSQAAEPNPFPELTGKPTSKSHKDKKDEKDKSASSKFSRSSASQASKQAATDAASQTAETLEDASNPTESPDPKVEDDSTQRPIKTPSGPASPISSLHDGLSLQQRCFNDKAATCVLLLVPASMDGEAPLQAIRSLSEIHHKHEQSGRNLFPFYQLPTANSQAAALRSLLQLGSGVELVATNAKRGWYKHYSGASFAHAALEEWIDAIRMGEGKKERLPENLIIDSSSLPTEPVEINLEDLRKMTAGTKGSMPEGLDVEFEEIDDVQYEAMMKQAEEAKKVQEEQGAEGHDEL